MHLVILPFHDWKKIESGGTRNRDGHLISHFSNSPQVEKILVVDRPISLPEKMLLHRSERCESGDEMARQGRAILSRISEKLFVLDMAAPDLVAPLHLRRDWWDHIFRQNWVIDSIRWAMTKTQIDSDQSVLVCFSPLATGPFGRIGECATAFDAIDNWCDHPVFRDRRGWIRRGYRTAIEKADVLTCNNENTADFLESLGGRPILIRNGVDLDVWNPKRWNGAPTPDDLARIPRPCIGYSGVLAARTDVDLIDHLARKRPDWSFVLVGPLMNKAWHDRLLNSKNVFFLGDKHYDLLPAYVSKFDVAAIFHRPETVQNMDPTKLYEYLALGLPVVSTPVAGASEFSDSIFIAEGPDQFESALEEALKSPRRPDESRRWIEEKGFTWSRRAQQMLELFDSALVAKKSSR